MEDIQASLQQGLGDQQVAVAVVVIAFAAHDGEALTVCPFEEAVNALQIVAVGGHFEVVGVILAGISLGNFIGGKIADRMSYYRVLQVVTEEGEIFDLTLFSSDLDALTVREEH